MPLVRKQGEVYICPNTTCFNEAIKGKRLQKALERDIPDDVLEKIKTQITDLTQH